MCRETCHVANDTPGRTSEHPHHIHRKVDQKPQSLTVQNL